MNDTSELEAEPFELEAETDEMNEFAEQEFESVETSTQQKVPHPQFGSVTPIAGEFGSVETFETEETLEDPGAVTRGKMAHPQFGMVTPVTGEFETTEDYEAAEELEFEAIDEEIIGGDERFRVSQTTRTPWRWVCYLEMRYPRFIATGSGLLIGPRHILTCSHNLFDKTSNTPARSVHASPGCNGVASRPFGRHQAASWKITNEYRLSGSPRFDFALITLRTPIGNSSQRSLGGQPLGYWGKAGTGTTIFQCRPGEPRLRGKRATLSGYPGDKPDGQQWAAKGQIVNVAPAAGRELIYYSSDSCAGHSGSPVWITQGSKAGLVGIHTGPCIAGNDCRQLGRSKCPNTPNRRETTSNRAVLITPMVWARVRAWAIAPAPRP